MHVLVVGAGPVALAMNALLAERQHRVLLFDPREPSAPRTPCRQVQYRGKVQAAHDVTFVASLAEGLGIAQIVIFAVTAEASRPLLEAAAADLRSDHMVIISSQLSLAALYLSRLVAARGVRARIASWGTTIATARFGEDRSVTVSSIRSAVPLSAIPREQTQTCLDCCVQLFGPRFRPEDDTLSVTLSNVNPQIHLALVIANFTRIERAESWHQNDGVTPGVGSMIAALDAERRAIATRFGYQVRSVVDHYNASFGLEAASMNEVVQALSARPGVLGPTSLATRYITEDVAYGVVFTEAMARCTGVASPVHSAGIEILNAFCGRDFRSLNAILDRLNLGGLSVEALKGLCRDGYSRQAAQCDRGGGDART